MSFTLHTKKIALVDCNSFYVSCERLFKPHILKKPVVVLSNNDGCIISRSSEAKALGIKMGDPYFKAKEIITKNKVYVFYYLFWAYSPLITNYYIVSLLKYPIYKIMDYYVVLKMNI